MDHKEVAARIRATAKRIPLGGTISVRGDAPISAFNFAEACARIVEDAACPHVLYRRLCDQPENSQIDRMSLQPFEAVQKEETMCERMKRYRVWMHSVPGCYAQYDGKVDVLAENDEDAIERAYLDLKRGAFPDRGRSMWKVERVERLFT